MPSGSRRNPSRRERAAQRAHRSEARTSEFLQVIELQLQAVTTREAALRRDRHPRSRSRSSSPAYSSRPRSRSPREDLRERQYRTRSPHPPSSQLPVRLDLNPHEEAGRTARPSPEEESVLGWTAYSEERERSTQSTPHNPFAADTYRPNYGVTEEDPRQRNSQYTRPARAGYRGRRGERRGRGTHRGRGQNSGRGSGRSLFDRINL
jgi:hypothetical protein